MLSKWLSRLARSKLPLRSLEQVDASFTIASNEQGQVFVTPADSAHVIRISPSSMTVSILGVDEYQSIAGLSPFTLAKDTVSNVYISRVGSERQIKISANGRRIEKGA